MATAIFELELPDGQILEMEADDTLSQEDVVSKARQQYPQYFPKQEPKSPFQGNLPDDIPRPMGAQPITARTGAEIAGMGLGGLIGGPVGAAGGYGIVDQLFSKYQDGQDITPGGAAKSFGTGLLYEAIPKAALWAGGRLIPKGVPEYLYKNAIKPSSSFDKKEVAKAVKTGLEDKIPVSRKGVDIIQGRVQDLNTKIDGVIDAYSQAGATIDPLAVVNTVRNLKKEYEFVGDNGAILKEIDHIADRMLEQFASKYGRTGAGINSIPIKDAQEFKKSTYRVLSNYYKRTVDKGVDPHLTPLKQETKARFARGQKEEITKAAPDVTSLNKKESDYLRLKGLIEPRVATSENAAIVPFDLMMAGIIESSMRGAPGAVTTIAGARHLTGFPGVKSRLALMLDAARQNKGGPVPPAAVTRAFQEYMNQMEGR